jgi:hypothetical protein
MPDIKFDTGVVTYSLNGAYEVSFNPTDSIFIEKIYAAIDGLDAKQDEYHKMVDSKEDARELFAALRSIDTEMRGILDDLLGDGASEAVFGDMNVYAFASGFPVWLNLLVSILENCTSAMNAETRKGNARIEKYTSKYHK